MYERRTSGVHNVMNETQTRVKPLELDRFVFSDIVSPDSEANSNRATIVHFWQVLQKRRWLILGCLCVIGLVVTAISLMLPKRYDATSQLLLDLEGEDDLGLDQVVMPIGIDLDTKLQTQVRIVQSDTIANSVIKQLGLQKNPAFAGKQAMNPARNYDSLDLRTRAALTGKFHQSLTVQIVPKTEIMEIHFRSGDPNLATDVANAVANTYIEH